MGEIGPEVALHPSAFVHSSAHIYGRVAIQEGASVWINAAIRAERHEIRVGAYSNIQDFAMLHVGWECGVEIGRHCSVTHHATLHGCIVRDRCLIGIGATIMDGCVIGENSVVAGHSIVSEGSVIPPHSVVMGTPGRVVATRDSGESNLLNAMRYYRNAQAYALGNHRAWESDRTSEWDTPDP